MTAPVTATACARAGLAGNPSDGYGGAVVAAPVAALRATVEVIDAGRVQIAGPPDEWSWPDVASLVDHVDRYGHEGGQRLVSAAVSRLARWAGEADREVDDRPFLAKWRTEIPRSVGLAGSSALVVATMRALAQRWELEVPADVLAVLALEAERDDLGIAAGIQDRAVQAHGATVLVDASGDAPSMRVLRAPAPIPLLVAWDPSAAAPSHDYHARLRRRFDDGEPAVEGAMAALASLGRAAAGAVEAGDASALAELVDATWEARRALGVVAPAQEAMVASARDAGMVATSAGSGGSIVAVVTEDGQPERFGSIARTASMVSASAGDLSGR